MKRLKLPKRNSKVYKLIYDRGYFAGYNHGVSATKVKDTFADKQDDVELERQKVQLLNMAGQSVQSLANLGEAYSRLIMYASNQRFPKEDERKGW